ncbi:MAG: CoA pyrophosphatase [Gammaproteobacteria bacterium]|nr:CoA pyrophosphatase [Gammaproteobacteria bacterium]MYD77300.1 CoA pyrophosphatase [Gammaproteobacteria bacterium]MYJ51872.1 CoA pyrophosphatase [Gammaproteobacteria bacterium]
MSRTHALDGRLRQQISDRLDRFDYRAIADDALRHAAVVLAITGHEVRLGHPSVLLTRRPKTLGRHSGQYALPGGKVDPGETSIQAALRELHEELGVVAGPDRVLGRLDDYPTRSKFRITPVVVWLDNECNLVPSPDEVCRVFRIPFEELDSEAIPVFEPGIHPDRPVLCSEFPTLGHRMYSPTAAILYQFREVAIRGDATRVAHYDQPRFAWQ